MVRLEKHGDSAVRFIFTDSDHYLYKDGVVDVPVNSLSLVIDESEMVTFKKASTGDPFISFRLDKSNFSSRDELLTFYKENMVGAGGISEEEVQEMIDAATSGIPSSEVVEQLRTDVNTLSGNTYSKSQIDGFLNTAEQVIATKADSSALTEVRQDVNTLSGKVDTKVDATTYESGQYATAQALNALQENKLDASAYTPTDLSEYWTSGQTQEAINAATSGIPSSQVIEQLQTDVSNLQGETNDIWDTIDEKEEVIASALTQLNQDVSEIDAKEEVIASALTEVRQDVANKQDALSAGTGIEISGNVISATGGALLVNFDDLKKNMNDEKWDELVDALQNNKPIFEGYNNSEGDITDAGQNIVDGYVYPDEYSDPDDEFGTITSIEVMSLTAYYAGGYRELIITKKGSEDYEVSNYKDDYQPMGDYQPAMTAGSGISIDENYVISVTGAPITVDSELDETSNNPVANSAITNAITSIESSITSVSNDLNTLSGAVIDNEYTVSQAINSLNNRVIAVESTKQDTLVSGTNIKTINGESILGEGNITIEGGGMDDDTQQLISTAFNDLNDRKADLTELSKYQKKGDYVKTSTLADYMTNDAFDEYATAKERIISGALNDLNDKFGGLRLVKISQAEYDALATKDSSTLYIISD